MYFVQLKLFSLPGLAACGKYKVTANEGVVVRRAQVSSFTSLAVGHRCCEGNKRNSTDSYFQNSNISENCLLFISNLGEISAFSLPELKCQVTLHQCQWLEGIFLYKANHCIVWCLILAVWKYLHLYFTLIGNWREILILDESICSSKWQSSWHLFFCIFQHCQR